MQPLPNSPLQHRHVLAIAWFMNVHDAASAGERRTQVYRGSAGYFNSGEKALVSAQEIAL